MSIGFSFAQVTLTKLDTQFRVSSDLLLTFGSLLQFNLCCLDFPLAIVASQTYFKLAFGGTSNVLLLIDQASIEFSA